MKRGSQIDDFIFNERLGHGGFGEVWASTSIVTALPVAIKIQALDQRQRKLLEQESEILTSLQDLPYFPHFIKYWEDGNNCFLAMERLQLTVKDTTESAHEGRLSLKRAASLGLQMLVPLAALHERGYVHRDIKPSNFMYRPGTFPPEVCLIDFGLAKVWRDEDGVVPARSAPLGFTGTFRYASVRSHEGAELSCRDDLWSFFCILVEMVAPPLPWHRQENQEFLVEVKRRSRSKLVLGLPQQFQEIQDYIEALAYEDLPDYYWIRGKLQELLEIGEREDQIAAFSNLGSLTEVGYTPGTLPRHQPPSEEQPKCCCLLM
jgi:serine/threonine protein kinase